MVRAPLLAFEPSPLRVMRALALMYSASSASIALAETTFNRFSVLEAEEVEADKKPEPKVTPRPSRRAPPNDPPHSPAASALPLSPSITLNLPRGH